MALSACICVSLTEAWLSLPMLIFVVRKIHTINMTMMATITAAAMMSVVMLFAFSNSNRNNDLFLLSIFNRRVVD